MASGLLRTSTRSGSAFSRFVSAAVLPAAAPSAGEGIAVRWAVSAPASPPCRLFSLGARGDQSPTSSKEKWIDSIRIGGVEMPNHKRVQYSLQSIRGIGRTRARQILSELSLENKVTKDLTQEEVSKLRKEVSKYMIEGDLMRFNRLAIERLEGIRCYRGIRHEQGLPIRGQRTKTNCRTLKGKRASASVAKKKSRASLDE